MRETILRIVTIPIFLGLSVSCTAEDLLWIRQDDVNNFQDIHAAFRGSFYLSTIAEVEIRLSGASWYRVWMDGDLFAEGPDRYAPDYPLYQVRKLSLTPGKHLIAIHVHSNGLDTRMLQGFDPFLFCKVFQEGTEVPVDWKSIKLEGYAQQLRRVSAQFGWLEWSDTRQQPSGWQELEFDDAGWDSPVIVTRELENFQPSLISEVRNYNTPFEIIDSGPLASYYGYETDNPSARFFLRDQECIDVPSQGIWKRYDLGKVRLIYPRFVLELPEGAVVEFAFSESLKHGRVMPWINLSVSDSYNMVHFRARGGRQEFFPITPKGGRFVEMHIIAPPANIGIIEEQFIERRYYNKPDGAFACDDTLINRIWQLGADTYMSCAEDALVDNPTRERGEWMGDVGIVGLQIGAATFSDLKIIKSGLTHFALCAREDGMIAGLAPGNLAYLSSYAALWINANLNYWKLTGDRSLLEQLYPYAERNIAAFEKHRTSHGINQEAGWAFIDWGYVPCEGESDMGLNLIYHDALRAMVKWSRALKLNPMAAYYERLADRMQEIIGRWYDPFFNTGEVDWAEIGYHRTVLGLRNGFIPPEFEDRAINYIKQHILNCFPNNDEAPRLSNPGTHNPQLITPYFAHYTFPLLIEHGEMEFVLDQYKTCWGWMLNQGATTCLEVFDTRWSHCHQWAGCPTWQLSRYCLGLHPAFDRTENSFDLILIPGYLEKAQGRVPLPGGKTVQVNWIKSGNRINYSIETPVPIEVYLEKPDQAGKRQRAAIKKQRTLSIPISE